MKPYHFTMLGLVLDILGAFFVSAEAIKIENLRTFKNAILMPLHKATLSPKIELVGDKLITHCSRKFLFFFTVLHYVAGILLLVATNWVLNGKLVQLGDLGIRWLFSKQWYWIVAGLLMAGGYSIVGGLWMLGEIVHMTLTYSTRLLISLVELIEAKTPDGTVGILGFLLLLTGFILQMVGTYMGGATLAIAS